MASRIPDLARAQVRTRDQWRCVRCGCPTDEGDWHHRRSRSIKDEHQHAPCNGINLCRTCHSWVHAHPFEARARGWIVSRYAVPCEIPAFSTLLGWVLLDHAGEMKSTPDPMEEGG